MPLNCIPAHTDPVRTLGFAAIGAPYVAIGGIFGHKMRMIRIVNMTDGNLMFSDDGVADKWPVPAGSFVLYDYAANCQSNDGILAYAMNTQIYVKQITAPTTGSAYVECTYMEGQ